MIKVGIYGPSEQNSPLRKQLLRLLLRHPDVDLRTVAAKGANSVALTQLYPVYTGETELRLESKPQLDKLDVLFVIDEENLTEEIMATVKSNPELRLIVMGNASKLRMEHPEEMIYGFAECNRKSLVRGARMAVSPSPVALLVETALFPSAKQWQLPKKIEGTIALPYKLNQGEIDEAVRVLKCIQNDFTGDITLTAAHEAPYERIDMEISFESDAHVTDLINMYNTAYEDHNFSYVIPGEDGIDEDLRGSNKCLMQIFEKDGKIHINASADWMTRSNAGNAVHIMNLLFGLHERTGLSI